MFPKAGIWHRAPHGAAARPALCRHGCSLPGLLLPRAPLTCLSPPAKLGRCTPGPQPCPQHSLAQPGAALPASRAGTAVHPGTRGRQGSASPAVRTPRCVATSTMGLCSAEALQGPGHQPSPWPPPTPTADFPAEHQGLVFRAQLSVLWKHGNDIPMHGADLITSVTHRN